MGDYFYPRHWARITCPLYGSSAQKQQSLKDTNAVTIDLRLLRSRLSRNNHNQADELELLVDWRAAGIDPRMLTSARVQFYAGDARSRGPWQPSAQNLRFVGVMTSPTRRGGGGSPMTVEMKFHDYTDFFLKQKPFPPEGLPELTDDLRGAWAKICEKVGFYDLKSQAIVSSVSDLKDALLFVGPRAQAADGVSLGRATSKRFQSVGGKVQMKPGSDAWALWNQCCGMLGLITFFRQDRVIIVDATDYYTADNPPVLTWGTNIGPWSESSGSDRAHKGVGATIFDPLTHSTIEAFYPPPGDPRITMKRTPAASKKKSTAAEQTLQSENYEMFANPPGITDAAALLDWCRRVFEEYSRQQVGGEVETKKMALPTLASQPINPDDFDSLDPSSADVIDPYDLGSGDAICLKFDTDLIRAVAKFESLSTRIEYLMGLGYLEGVATLIANNLESFKGLPPIFHIQSMHAEIDTTSEPGSFNASIQYVNVLNPFGAASLEDGGDASANGIAASEQTTKSGPSGPQNEQN